MDVQAGRGRARSRSAGCGLPAQVEVGSNSGGTIFALPGTAPATRTSAGRNADPPFSQNTYQERGQSRHRWGRLWRLDAWILVNVTAPSECRARSRSSGSVTDVVTYVLQRHHTFNPRKAPTLPVSQFRQHSHPRFCRTSTRPNRFLPVIKVHAKRTQDKPPKTMNTAQSLPRFLLPRLSWQGPLSPNVARTVPSILLQAHDQQPRIWQPLCSSRCFHSSQPTDHAQCTAPSNKPRSLNIIARNPSLRRSFHASAARRRDHHFDTLKFVQRLQEDGFTEEQSVAMMKVLNDVIEER